MKTLIRALLLILITGPLGQFGKNHLGDRDEFLAGLKGNWRPLNLGAWSVVHVNDEQGFSVELLFVRPWYDRIMGFLPKPAPKYKRKKSMKTWISLEVAAV